jgi:nitrogen regulatory protein PII
VLKIDTVIRNTCLSQIKARLEQAGIQNYSIYEMNSDNRPSFCVPRSKIEIICKTSQKDSILQAISGADEQGGLIYVNQLTTLINLNNTK